MSSYLRPIVLSHSCARVPPATLSPFGYDVHDWVHFADSIGAKILWAQKIENGHTWCTITNYDRMCENRGDNGSMRTLEISVGGNHWTPCTLN